MAILDLIYKNNRGGNLTQSGNVVVCSLMTQEYLLSEGWIVRNLVAQEELLYERCNSGSFSPKLF